MLPLTTLAVSLLGSSRVHNRTWISQMISDSCGNKNA